MMPSNYFSERTLEEAIDVFVQTFAALDPAQPTTRQLSERWQRLCRGDCGGR